MEEQAYTLYPRDDINPKDKDTDWGMQYLKAAWYDWNFTIPRTVFYNSADKYEELRLYACGKQPVNLYKKLMGVDEQTNLTYLNLDWTPRPFIIQKRDVAISKVLQMGHDIVATPIDPTAKAELDKYYADAKAKIAMRQMLQQQGSDLAQHPMLAPQPGEPLDFEEMQMRIDFGEQFNRSKDAEEAIQLGFYGNDMEMIERTWVESLFDTGVAGYREWLGDDNKPKARPTNVEAVVTNYCHLPNFKDLKHAGEVTDVLVIDLAVMKGPDGKEIFTADQIRDLETTVAGRWSNPSMVGRSTNYWKGFDKFKVKTLDMEFFSYNDYSYEVGEDKRGNTRFARAPYENRNKEKKIINKKIKVVYCCKWIIGTNYAYDFHMKEDMKRAVDPKKKADTSLSFKFVALNFYEMRATGFMERLRPIIDDYQLTIYRIQNLKARIVPNGWWIDLDALENVALNKSGENMKPIDLLNMFFETGVLAGRSQGVMGDNVNYKPIIPLQNSIATELQALYNDLQISMNQMQSMIGLNDITDASTPSPKLLNGVATMMDQGTNNSLWPLMQAKKWLKEQLANDMLIRMQQGLRKGGVGGYAPALNTNTLKFIQLSDTLCLRDYGIMLEEKPTDEQKQLLYQQMQFDIQNGFLDTSDALYIMNVYNLKQAQMILAYRAKRNKQDIEQNKQAATAQTIQGQQQSAQQAQQMAMQLEQVQHQNKMELQTLIGSQNYQIKQLEMGIKSQDNSQTNQVKMAGHVLAAQTKENSDKRSVGVPEAQIPSLSGAQPAAAGMEQNIPESEMV